MRLACVTAVLLTLLACEPWPAQSVTNPWTLTEADGRPDVNPQADAPPSDEEVARRLRDSGAPLRPAPVSSTKGRGGVACAMTDGVRLLRGATGLRWNKPPHVNARFALKLLTFETILQDEAQRAFAQPVRQVVQLGTYVCRDIAGTAGSISEHASGNAIDVTALVLRDGRRVDVKRDFARGGIEPRTPAGTFLASLIARLRAERVFSVILTPDWDARHANHLHLDDSARFSLWRWVSRSAETP